MVAISKLARARVRAAGLLVKCAHPARMRFWQMQVVPRRFLPVVRAFCLVCGKVLNYKATLRRVGRR